MLTGNTPVNRPLDVCRAVRKFRKIIKVGFISGAQQCPSWAMTSPSHAARNPRRLDQVRDRIRLKHYSIRTEQAYLDWIKRFILFHGKLHPVTLGASEVGAFLTHLAVNRNVAAATQNRARSALLFLYKEAPGIELPCLYGVEHARTPARLPVVLTRDRAAASRAGIG